MRPSPATAVVIVVSIALLTDSVLYYAVVPLLPALADRYHLGQMGVGVLVGSYAWSLLLGTVPFGRLADRVGRRGPLLWGLLGLAASTLLFARVDSYPMLVVARVLQGLSATVTWTAGMALLVDHFDAKRRPQAMAVVFTVANAGVLLGPPLSGFLAQRFGLRAPFYFVAALALVDAAARVLLLRRAPPPAAGVHLGYFDLLRNGMVRRLAGAMVAGAAVMSMLEATLPLHLGQSLRYSAAMIGLCFGVAAVAHLASSPLVTGFSHRVGRVRVVVVGLLLVAVLLPIPPYLVRPVAVMAVLAAIAFCVSLILGPVSPGVADVVEAQGSTSFASVFGLLNIAYAAGMALGPYVGGALVAALGLRRAFLVAGVACAGYALTLVRRRKAA